MNGNDWTVVGDRVYFGPGASGGISLHMFKDGKERARLIAAAPKLLAMLKEIAAADDAAIEELRDLGVEPEGAAFEMTKRIWQLLAEVEGRTP